jgi:putative hydrolase of HD superfamily
MVRMMAVDRLLQQIDFVMHVDRLKTVLRRTPLVDASRAENVAEHSWHLVLAALVFCEYTPVALDLLRVLEMLAVHDLVEIDAGDTFAFDLSAQHSKGPREQAAAARIFGLLPSDQAVRLRSLWEEFDAQVSPESAFANAVDRLQALLQDAYAGGGSWLTQRLSRDQVLGRMAPVESALPRLWPLVLDIVDASCKAGLIGEAERSHE